MLENHRSSTVTFFVDTNPVSRNRPRSGNRQASRTYEYTNVNSRVAFAISRYPNGSIQSARKSI
jgi:hypothetical protein